MRPTKQYSTIETSNIHAVIVRIIVVGVVVVVVAVVHVIVRLAVVDCIALYIRNPSTLSVNNCSKSTQRLDINRPQIHPRSIVVYGVIVDTEARVVIVPDNIF